MIDNNFKKENISEPIEKQRTAAWANIEKLEPHSRVPIPNEDDMQNAKKWVDKNKK